MGRSGFGAGSGFSLSFFSILAMRSSSWATFRFKPAISDESSFGDGESAAKSMELIAITPAAVTLILMSFAFIDHSVRRCLSKIAPECDFQKWWHQPFVGSKLVLVN